MRIAALVPEAFGGRGGIALYDSDLLMALSEQEDCEEITVLPRLLRDAVPGNLPKKLDFRISAAQGTIGFIFQWLRLLWVASRYDLIICGHINLLPFASILRYRARTPLILVIYGIDAWPKPVRKIKARLAEKVDAVISISDFTRQRFTGWARISEDKIFLLPNALHSERYAVGRKPEYLEQRYALSGCRVILTLGRLLKTERYKGVDEILELMPAILADDPTIRYLVVGDGDDRSRLEYKARELGIAEHVVFAGWVDESEKPDHYRLADAFVMAGRGEGFGFVFLEAMACGIPVVASRLDGSREAVLDGEIGLLADPGNRDDLFTAVVSALSTPRQIPDGLQYFYYENFRSRLGEIISVVMRSLPEAV